MLFGGDGKDGLWGEAGDDTFFFVSVLSGNYGTDKGFRNNETIAFANKSMYTTGDYELDGNDVLIHYANNQGTIKIVGGKGKTANFANGSRPPITFN